jgi:alkyl hydroperoxide reductase subunit AhpC
MRSIFIVDREGVIRYRHTSRTGATYRSVADIEQALASVA